MKLKKIFFIIICLFIIITPFAGKAEDELYEYQRGDLRCPIEYNNKGCVETKDANGKVTSVRISKSEGNYSVTKIVSKTDNLGEYNVRFETEGETTTTTTGRAYVMIIIDGSSTMGSNYADKAVPKAKEFARHLNNYSGNIYISFASFHNRVFASRGFAASTLDAANFSSNVATSCSNGHKTCYVSGSSIYLAFNYAKNQFSGKDGKKYIVILGDGKYYDKEGDFGGSSDTRIKDLKKIVDGIYSVKYGVSGKNNCYPKYYFRTTMQGFEKYPGYYVKDKNMNNLGDIFTIIANQIEATVSTDVLPGYVTDNLGDQFILTEGVGRKKVIGVSDLASTSFNIKIDPLSQTGWHDTNAGFTFNYGDGELSSNINPEVYWDQEKYEFSSCSEALKIGSPVVSSRDYYTITCDEGWNGVDGYRVTLTTNNQPFGTHSFSLGNGSGFPIDISLVNNVKCRYEFNKEAFIDDYNDLIDEIANESDEREKAVLMTDLEKLVSELDVYIRNSNNLENLKNHQEKVEKQAIALRINYKNSSDFKEVLFTDKGDTNSNIACNDSVQKNETILDKNVIVNRECSVSISKSMQLPLTCLEMKSGEASECDVSSNTQISGGNNFYTDLDKAGGYVSISIENATYFGNTIKLEGDHLAEDGKIKCEFNVDNSLHGKIKFRQIELSDPFIQGYTNNTRKIGKNWLNNNYNFAKIIKEDIWNNKFEYQYDISKVDIEKIKSDTAEIGVNSYLGKSCRFADNSTKYICDFIRPTNNGSNNFFTNITVHD